MANNAAPAAGAPAVPPVAIAAADAAEAPEDPNAEEEVFIPVTGQQIAQHPLSDEQMILQCLYWIGFRTDAQRDNITNESFSNFDDIRIMSTSDVNDMASDWASRTVANGRMHFGARRSKLLKAFIHWTHDFYRVSTTPTIENLNEDSFKNELRIALTRATTRKTLSEQTKTTAEAASPGPLESERTWKQWEEKFTNYTRSHIGTHGIPLSYVIREEDNPDDANEYSDFITKTIACAPLSGEFYIADRLTVFNMIVAFTTGQTSSAWIKHTLKSSNGRLSMKALRDHFTGEGNATRNIAEADRLKDSLHYNNERSMTFENFLTQCQKMYNIYDKEEEPMSDEAKVRFLFKSVHHEKLQVEISALKAQITAGTPITYTMASNHLSTAVSELPEYIAKNRNVSSLNKGQTPRTGNSAIYNGDGSIITGHIPSWRSLSSDDRAIVMNERKRLGIQSKKGNNAHKSRNKNSSSSDANRLKQLQDQNKKYKRQIKAMKRSDTDTTPEDSKSENEDSVNDAGDEFGGRNNKATKRRKTK
jgi:hypothetical protein